MAQATIYGRTDVAYGIKAFSNANGATHMKQQGVMDGANAGSRIGFRGTEDLGGGMKAHFVTEQGLSPTNGAVFGVRTGNSGLQYDGLASSTNQFDTGTAGGYTQGTNRQTYLGLEGGFGTVRVGYQYTAAYEVGTLSGFTNTSEGAIGGEIAHLWGAGAVGGTRANAITYMTPRMNGFMATIQMGSAGGREQTEWLTANTATGTTLDKQARTSLQIDYTAGPLRTGLAYTQFNSQVSGRAAGTTTNQSVSATTSAVVITTFNVLGALSGWNVSPVTGNTTYSANLLQLAGSYDFGAVKVGLTLNSGTKDVTEGPSAVTFGTQPSAAAGNAVASTKYASRALSFLMPMGKMDLVGGMANSSLDVGPTATNDWATRQVGVKYNFSKRTIAYGFIGSSSDNLAATTAVKDKSQTIVGIDHQF
jgi:predicted porin